MEGYYKIESKEIKNSDKFRPAAIHFEKYGYYTATAKGTTAYIEYWDREVNRCIEGYTAEDGEKITGYHYYYLNYFPIVKIVIDPITDKAIKKRGFPDFYDYDYIFFNIVEEAEKIGKHLAVLKARRKGYSYKIASMMCRNYFLIPESKSYAYAAENEFLVKDGILTKAWDGMDFVDENTAWYKKRQKIDTKMHKRASFVIDAEGVKTELGYKSEIIGVTLKNDVHKVRGKSGKLIVFEEAGKLPNLKSAWITARPSVEQGESVHGLMIAFGTGGTEDADYEGLKDLFYEPEVYGVLPIENIWDEGANKPCGFFVPTYMNISKTYMDDDGNTLFDKSVKYSLNEREKVIKNATDRSVVDKFICEYPFNPQEATLQVSGNIFPKAELTKHLAYIRTNSKIKDFKQVGRLLYDKDGLIKWEQMVVPCDLTSYRVGKGCDPKGAVVIWEHPDEDSPYGTYIAGADPYDHDKSGTNSLGSVFIYKRFQSFERFYDTVVAEYTGRPETANDFYENVLKLLKYYNATLLYENQNPGLSVYFRNKHVEYLLADQPNIISKIVKDSKVQRSKGTHMTVDIKDWAEGRLRDWLIEEYEPGKLNLTKILSEPLLEELIAYNDKGNFDRVVAMFCVMIYKEELHDINVKKKEEETYYTNRLFPDGIYRYNSYHYLN
jgi:hypothetical protein